jgi:hypothetical protein
MPRKANNKLLQKAKKSKSDEFYTQLCDIESELQYYSSHFTGKVVYCNCDDPRVSNFFKYFSKNFDELGIKKIITSCYTEKSGQLSSEKKDGCGFFFEYSNSKRERLSLDNIEVTSFAGDGDFRSLESIELLEKADIVVTNPPFSLFREYLEQLIRYNKKFLLIANVNAITYKEVFNHIKENKLWLGINLGRGISGFIVPPHYELYGTETKIDESGNRIISPNNCLWLTNLDTFIRHKDILLTKKYFGNEEEYPKYDNYDAINVNKTKDIPSDYKGVMGVPITFLHKFNPEQFEIIKFRKGNDEKDLSINGKSPYFRILIKNKRL